MSKDDKVTGTEDKAQLAALGRHFQRVASGEVKPFDREAFDRRPKIGRMGFSPEEMKSLKR